MSPEVNRPYILSLHPTMQCDFGCTNCYLKKDEEDTKEQEPQFFMDILAFAKKVGIKEVAIPINYANQSTRTKSLDKNRLYFEMVGKFCKENSLRFTATANHDFFRYYSDLTLNGLDLISISVNDFVTGSDVRIEEAIEVMKELKSKVGTVNCNILLSERMVRLLKEGLSQRILEVADSMYLLASKPLQTSNRTYYGWYNELNDAGILVDSPKIIVDSCMRYALGLTGGVCDRMKMIYLNPYGEIKMCSFDKRNLAVLQKPEDFEYAYEKYFPFQKQESCSLVDVE